VRADSGCKCGQVLRTRQRAIASDAETCAFHGRHAGPRGLCASRHAGRAEHTTYFP
jgi:hypothetical protein